MSPSIQRVWKLAPGPAAIGLRPMDRVIELTDGSFYALRSVGVSATGFALTALSPPDGRRNSG